MALVVEGLCCGYAEDKPIIKNLDFSLGAGKVTTVLGPNGVGKTTLFKAILGFLQPRTGSITIDGKAIAAMGRAELARAIAYVPQIQSMPFAYTVEETVLMGRAPHLKLLEQPRSKDCAAALHAMELMGIDHLAKKTCTEISGGERQMVFIARALAQEPQYFVMDEPTASLDFGNQVHVLERIIDLTQGKTGMLISTHDPSQAFTLKSDVLVMQHGYRCCSGYYRDVLTEELMHQTYGVEVIIRSIPYAAKQIECCMALIKETGHRHIRDSVQE
ncbi:MAG: ABC transporter ATP-binding protein [Coriobacteriales bacterium]|nr:ABC transporter ATP-binding protein [Coriobacteriales bacterium]